MSVAGVLRAGHPGLLGLRIDPGFEQSPTDPLHLLLLMADLRAAVALAAGMPSGR
jgi:hypothetical protein